MNSPLSKADLYSLASMLDSTPIRPQKIWMNAKDAAEIMGERCEVCLSLYLDLKLHSPEECDQAVVRGVMEV